MAYRSMSNKELIKIVMEMKQFTSACLDGGSAEERWHCIDCISDTNKEIQCKNYDNSIVDDLLKDIYKSNRVYNKKVEKLYDYLKNLLEELYEQEKEVDKMNILKDVLEEKYTGVNITIKTNGTELNGTIYGDDECFDLDGFYQYFVEDNSGCLLKLYYAIDEDSDYDSTIFDTIDYECPDDIQTIDIKKYF